MRHRRAGTKLGRLSAHREALFRNLLTALLRHERIETTVAKAKALRPQAERLVTLAKSDTLHARRQVLAVVPDTAVVRQLFDQVAARYADRRGGYTRILLTGRRQGDAAPMALLEFVDRPAPVAEKDKKGKKAAEPKGKAAKKARKAAGAAG